MHSEAEEEDIEEAEIISDEAEIVNEASEPNTED